MKKPTLFSFFSGAGFLDLGFELSGFEVGFVNEIHPPFMQTYRYSRQLMNIAAPKYGYYEGDINDLIYSDKKEELAAFIREATKETFTGFIGGPPCPDFSVGGKNRGHEGDHGKLSSSYINLICCQRPHFFVFENVKGLWKTKKHRAFYEQIKLKLHQAGYVTTERLINSIEYGVPQDRQRIILIGFRKDILDAMGVIVEGDTIPEGRFPWDKHIKYPAKQVFGYPWPQEDIFGEDFKRKIPEGIPEDLTVEYWFGKNEVDKHPNSKHCFNPRAGISRFMSVAEGDVSKKSYKRLHRWRYSPTACYGNNEVHLHPYKPRRISAAEALAIQSLPKEYVLPPKLTLSNMFKTVGNGVPFLAAQAIAKTILDFLGVIENENDSCRHSDGNRTFAEEQSLSLHKS